MERVQWVIGDCLSAIARIARLSADEAVDAQGVHARLRARFASTLQRARDVGYTDEDARLMLYALAALADEVAMSTKGSLREHWATQPLQLLLFRENVAGERFFQHLARLRRQPGSIDVLRTYYLCLLLGFRGRFGLQGEQGALQALIDDVRAELLATLAIPERLAPRSDIRIGAVQPVRVASALRLCAGAVLMTLALHLGLLASLHDELAQLVVVSEQVTKP